ncbi:hypothetical protein C1645_785831 [Glomus cerebriforme]|uniref:Uncharacterized protein n=1 Tax=Glomus cerebriforme TaxID=658196 RepID=A0A397SI60_9GLOM|nr:hypothetical protein C1645_785831 [Glomus cerebriforme]
MSSNLNFLSRNEIIFLFSIMVIEQIPGYLKEQICCGNIVEIRFQEKFLFKCFQRDETFIL